MEDFRSSQPREGAAARGFRARSTFGACRASGKLAGFADRIGFGWVRSLLFDKSIGRKRDVGGVVLAGSLPSTRVRPGLTRFPTRPLTVTFPKTIIALDCQRWNAVRRAGAARVERVCLELVKTTAAPQGYAESDPSGLSSHPT